MRKDKVTKFSWPLGTIQFLAWISPSSLRRWNQGRRPTYPRFPWPELWTKVPERLPGIRRCRQTARAIRQAEAVDPRVIKRKAALNSLKFLKTGEAGLGPPLQLAFRPTGHGLHPVRDV